MKSGIYMNKQEFLDYLKLLIAHIEGDTTGEMSGNIEMLPYPIVDQKLYDELAKNSRGLQELRDCCLESRNTIMHGIYSSGFEFIVRKGEAEKGRKNLREWLANCHDLVICDPYFFDYSKPSAIYSSSDDYITKFKSLIPEGLKTLKIIYSDGTKHFCKSIVSSLQQYCSEHSINFETVAIKDLHDRVWIKNKTKAKSVGTSFNGLGNKLSFFLKLSKEDLLAFKQELQKQGVQC